MAFGCTGSVALTPDTPYTRARVRTLYGSTEQAAVPEAIVRALNRALSTRRTSDLHHLIHHSDRGCQYTSHAFRRQLTARGITQTRIDGNVYSNDCYAWVYGCQRNCVPWGGDTR